MNAKIKNINISQWSDGEALVLQEGQKWSVSPEESLTIISLDEHMVTFQYSYHNKPETQRIEGTDGFIDMLESCGYIAE